MRAAVASSAARQRHAQARARSRKAVAPPVIGARRDGARGEEVGEEDKKMSMTCGIHCKITYGEYRFKETVGLPML